ncbi:hypothetical protein BDW02DRAFT_618598, partial [Decorospora gaudefroyi]
TNPAAANRSKASLVVSPYIKHLFCICCQLSLRNIASCAGRIPLGQIPETSRGYATDSSADIDAVVKDVVAWLARPANTTWLLIFDNVDREYKAQRGDPNAYDVRRYLSGADQCW